MTDNVKFLKGQRWISESEPELGLGLISSVSKYQVEIHFPASEETRIFATENAPLKRVVYTVGDTVHSKDGTAIVIETINEVEGLFVYQSANESLVESELSEQSNFGKPEERLFQGQVDRSDAYALRYKTLNAYSKARQSSVAGFLGGRIDLIPHQLFIANEVASRHCPRVLLSDEVGLGKTIEACLILHRLLLSGRASRVLIMVPESLVHQWFVELYRRFNLWFTIMDADRCSALALSSSNGNPFLEEQLVICSVDTLKEEARWAEAISQAEWDLLIVDEAHHYEWKPDFVSDEYALIDALSGKSNGLILLTATPEQMGIEGHFARLRLLDPNRYPDLNSFIKEHEGYQRVAEVANAVYLKKKLSQKASEQLRETVGEIADSEWNQLVNNREKLLEALVDRFGTGRVIFRNSRQALKGFPKRVCVPHALESLGRISKSEMEARLLGEFQKEYLEEEVDYEYDFKNDPRIYWLIEFLKAHPSEKVLLICKTREKVEALQSSLLELITIKIAVFHEALSLIQRDRNAAYFAEVDGAQILLCSEIGSEGRNFQFSHHLVLLDLPLNPELLEQRIGRLDRIGQTSTIQIHIPYVPNSWTELLFRWHNEALEGIENSLKGGHLFYESFKDQLIQYGMEGGAWIDFTSNQVQAFLSSSKAHRAALEKDLDRGQNCLIAINSYRPNKAEAVVEAVRKLDQDASLEGLMNQLFDFFGVTVEKLSSKKYLLTPEHLFTESFPSLPEEGMMVSFDRKESLSREDVHFLTWDHPMVRGAMDLMVGAEQGNASLVVWNEFNSNVPALMLECIFILESVAPLKLHIDRFLPPSPIRVLVDLSGEDCSKAYTFEAIQSETNDEEIFRLKESPEVLRSIMPQLLESAHAYANNARLNRVESAYANADEHLSSELARLLELKKVNSNVSDAEIDHSRIEREQVVMAIQNAQLRLDSVCLVLNNQNFK